MKTKNFKCTGKRVMTLFLVLLCLMGTSCGREDIYLLSQDQDVMETYNEENTEASETTEALETTDSLKDSENTSEKALTSERSEDSDKLEESSQADEIYVYVCGKVRYPGVYHVKADARVYEAVDLAGGLADEADRSAVNLASYMQDGQMIYIPSEGEETEVNTEAGPAESNSSADGMVNINTAGVSELTTLTGIGEVKANSIIDYRQNNGAFKSIEDIMNVSGIGDGCYQKIKDHIKVE